MDPDLDDHPIPALRTVPARSAMYAMLIRLASCLTLTSIVARKWRYGLRSVSKDRTPIAVAKRDRTSVFVPGQGAKP